MKISISESKVSMGLAAAAYGAQAIREAIQTYGVANIVVATAPSQNEMYDALVASEGIDWGCVNIFHLDEYIGLTDTHPASFRYNLRKTFLDRLPQPPKCFHPIPGEQLDTEAVCRDLEALIGGLRLDAAFIGIGENAHIAFNDPPADFETRASYRPVVLDEACRKQQYGEGWFPTMDAVPRTAVSMTVYQILQAKRIICTVPDARKAQAVKDSVEGGVTNLHPASILQTHPDCGLFLDATAASLLSEATRRAL